jgi:hypothetical protein
MGIEMVMAQRARPVGPIPLFHIPIPSHPHPGIEMVMAQRARPVGPIPLKYTFRVRVNLFFCYAPNGLLAAPTIGTLWPFSLLFFLVSSSPLVCPERSPFGAFFFVELCSPLSF